MMLATVSTSLRCLTEQLAPSIISDDTNVLPGCPRRTDGVTDCRVVHSPTRRAAGIILFHFMSRVPHIIASY